MGGVPVPEVVGQQRHELGGHEPHLRGELHGLLADERQVHLPAGPEDHHGLRAHGAVLGGPEREDVHPGRRPEVPQTAAERHRGVGQTGPVEVEQHPPSVGPRSDGRQLVRRVAGAELGGLGDGDHPGLHPVLVADAGGGRLQELGGQPAPGGGDADHLAPEEPFRGPALVDVDVGGVGGEDALERTEHRLEPDDVGAGAVEGDEGLRPVAEVPAEEAVGLPGDGVVAVGGGMAHVGGGDRLEDVGVDAGVVVAGEGPPSGLHGTPAQPILYRSTMKIRVSLGPIGPCPLAP